MFDQLAPNRGDTLAERTKFSHAVFRSDAGRPSRHVKEVLSRAMRKVQLAEPGIGRGLVGPWTQVWRNQSELRALDALAEDFSEVVSFLPVTEQGPNG